MLEKEETQMLSYEHLYSIKKKNWKKANPFLIFFMKCFFQIVREIGDEKSTLLLQADLYVALLEIVLRKF